MNEKPASKPFTLVHAAVILVVFGTIGPLVFITARAAGWSIGASVTAVAVTFAIGTLTIHRVVPDALPSHRRGYSALFGLWVLLGLAAGYRVVSLSVFMLDATRSEFAVATKQRHFDDEEMNRPFSPRHNCFTSYVIGARLAQDGEANIYDPEHYRDSAEPTDIHEEIGEVLTIDSYQYPPPFLLMPRVLLTIADGFFEVRTYWFTINVIVFSAAVAMLGYWIAGRRFSAFWLSWPIVVMAPTTVLTLQIGNVHFLIISMSLLAMALIEKGRERLGALVLGFVIVGKVFPGLLLVYLIFRRRWRAVVWTTGAMAAYCIATLVTFGAQVWQAFFDYQLPRLASGDAFRFARENARAITGNSSIMGFVYKLRALGLLEGVDDELLAGGLMWVFTAAILLMLFLAAKAHRRADGFRPVIATDDAEAESRRRHNLVAAWTVILILGQLRSPFLPWTYGNIAVLWLLAMLIPTHKPWRARTAAILLAAVVFGIDVPLPYGPGSTTWDHVYTLIALPVCLGICVVVIVRQLGMRPAPAPVRSGG